MAKYIDIENATLSFDDVDKQGVGDDFIGGVLFALDALTAKGEDIVRCKDCKWYRESELFDGINFCYRLIGAEGKHVGYNFSDDDFCSRGERLEAT